MTGTKEEAQRQFKELFPKFCADMLLCIDGEPPEYAPAFLLYRPHGLCTNFVNWCWLVPSVDTGAVGNQLHYLFRDLKLESAHPFDEDFSDYLNNPDKYSDDRPSNMLRLQFLKDHANV